MRSELSGVENAAPQNETIVIISPLALLEFDRFFLDWVDRNSEALEQNGSGNREELATLCAAWAMEYLAYPQTNQKEVIQSLSG